MQTAEEVEKHVPIREGEYGERVATVEPGGVEYIALKERHGKPIDLFWTWLSPNLEFATVFVGVIAIILFGLNLWEAATAIIVGTLLGSLTHAVVSSWGPKFGVPMMVESRGAFGFLGNILPAGLNAFTGAFGWFIVNSVSGAFALLALVGLSISWFWLTFLVIVVAQVAIATLGHNLIHVFERWALPLLGVVFGLACIFIFINGNYTVGFNAKAPLAFGGDVGGWILAFTAAFGYAAGWNPYAADYTRYMPPTTDRRMVGIWAGLGVLVSCVVLELAGAVLATVAGTKWGPNDIPTAQLQQAMPGVIYYLTLLCIAVGAVAANAINIYSGTMSLVALGIREMGLTLRQRRAALAILAGVIGYVGGLVFQAQVAPGGKYEAFLLLISYWIAPWLAVVFVDYWLRRGDYGDESIFYDPKHFRWQGFVAMAVGLVVSVYFFASNSLYVGSVPNAHPEYGDLTFVVGFVITAVLYFVFNLGMRGQTSGAKAAAGSRAP
ncbi:MAG TPA: cytosine permease [Chloroflexi bacterium]|jgi:NCS1 nucleoside transporter family|nr:cytosine permease [Chloroflexota bacterium]HAF21224.1 cytosine permease [Chloroflexota bacterium]